MREWLEVRIAISPIEHFFNRVRFIALSIRSLGGRYANTVTRVAVGSDEEPYDLHKRLPWSRDLGIDWYWVDRDEFSSWKDSGNPYTATIVHRFRPPFTAHNVLALDHDVIALRPFDDLMEMIETRPSVAGVMAHVTPFPTPDPKDHVRWWNDLYRAMNLAPPEFAHPLSGYGIMEKRPERRMSPVYFNSGVVLAPASLFEKLWPSYWEATSALGTMMESYSFDQISFTLALVKERIPYSLLPLRFNFPNDPLFDEVYAQELDDARFLHFLRTSPVDRTSSFENISTISDLARRRDLAGSNELLRRRIEELLPLAAAQDRPA